MSLEVLYRLDVNLVAFVVLGLYTWIALRRLDLSDALNRLYVFVALVVLTQLLIEAGTVWINRQPNLNLIPLSQALHMVLFMVGPVISVAWFYFMLMYVLDSKEIPKIIHVIAFSLLSVALFTAAASPITGWVFQVTNQNVYERGPFFLTQGLITYFYLLSATVLVIAFRHRILPQERPLLYIFGVLPVAGGMFQVLIYGLLTIWSSVAFTLVVGFIFLQERMLQTDYLSKAVTRESFMRFMARQQLKGSELLYGIVYMDMNNLKAINDQYGHAEGDLALMTMVRIVKEHLRDKESIVRMGGDEFLLVLKTTLKEHLNDRMVAIEDAFALHNARSNKPYALNFSYGADIYSSTEEDLEACIRRLDNAMYEDKQKLKVS